MSDARFGCAVCSSLDVFWPLSLGCSIVIPSKAQLQDPDATRELIQQQSVNFLMMPPSSLQVSSISAEHIMHACSTAQ